MSQRTVRDGDVKGPVRARWWLLTVSCLCVLVVMASMVALNTALANLAETTSASQAQLTWIVDGYSLTLACLLLPGGALGDRYGRRGALLVGLGVFGVASLAPVVFDSPPQIIAARVVAGVGAAFVMPATLSLLTAAYPSAERNKAVGIWAGFCGMGAIVGFLGTGVLLLFWSWQSVFVALAASAGALFAAAWRIGSSPDTSAKPVDWWGAVLVVGAVALFVFGVIEAPERGWLDPIAVSSITAGVLLAAAFTVVQLRSRYPLLDVRLFAQPGFAAGAAGITFLFFATYGYFFLIIQYLSLLLGYSPLKAAVALSPIALPMLVLGALTHWYLPLVGLRASIAGGLLITAAGLFATTSLTTDSTYLELAWPMVVMSTGIGLCSAPATSAITAAAPMDKQGIASAVNDTTRELGAALGIAVAGSLLAARYDAALRSALASYPADIRDTAAGSLAQALAVADRSGALGTQLAELAQTAFLQAMTTSLTALGAVLVIAAVLVTIVAPGRSGRPAPWIRYLRRQHIVPDHVPAGTTDDCDTAD